MLDEVIQNTGKENRKKVQINFYATEEKKEALMKICEENGVSFTSFMNSMIDLVIKESNGITVDSKEKFADLYNEYKEIIGKLSRYEQYVKVNGSLQAVPTEEVMEVPESMEEWANLTSRKAALEAIFKQISD